jgi:hypothetical protein
MDLTGISCKVYFFDKAPDESLPFSDIPLRKISLWLDTKFWVFSESSGKKRRKYLRLRLLL